MSYKAESSDLPTIPPLSSFNTQLGQLGDKSVVLAKKQTSEAWFIIAIIVGTFVVIGIGGFGTAGLLQSHGLISLPQGLASAIGTVGHTPHLWSLWAMAVGGGAIGIGLIAFGAIKIHQSPLRQINRAFGDNFAKIDESKGDDAFQSLARGKFEYWSKGESSDRFFFIVLKDQGTGELKCSSPLSKVEQTTLIDKLKSIGYSEAPDDRIETFDVNTDFGDNFAKINESKDDKDFTKLSQGYFEHWSKEEGNGEYFFIVLRDLSTGELKCSDRLTKKERDTLIDKLEDIGYSETSDDSGSEESSGESGSEEN